MKIYFAKKFEKLCVFGQPLAGTAGVGGGGMGQLRGGGGGSGSIHLIRDAY